MSDLIDRQALCDDLREYKFHSVPISSDESEVKGYNDGIDLAISVIAKFPSTESVRTAKVIIHKYWFNVSLNIVGEQTIGYEWICENCKKMVVEGDDYCSHCGCRLEW